MVAKNGTLTKRVLKAAPKERQPFYVFGTVYLTSAIHCHVKANKQPTSGFEAHLYLRIFSTEAHS